MAQTYADLINNLTNMRTNYFANLVDIIKKYPKVRKENNGRVTFYSKSIVVIDSVTMYCISADRHLLDNKWWTTSAQLYDLNHLR